VHQEERRVVRRLMEIEIDAARLRAGRSQQLDQLLFDSAFQAGFRQAASPL
jgi:hypothetical protein